MENICKWLLKWLKHDRYLCLLVALVLVLVVVPMCEQRVFGAGLKQLFLTTVFIGAVFANRQRRRLTLAATIVAAITIPLTWSAFFIEQYTLSMITYVVEICFLTTTTVLIIVSVVKDHVASVQSVYGAICIYLMIGLVWALIYSATEFAQSDSFAIARRDVGLTLQDGREMTSYSQMVYFSFVTMSTLGYGDMTPRTPVAQTFAWMQAVTGQFYLAVLVARLIGVLPSHSRKQSEIE